MRKTTYLFIKAQGRATRRVLLESLAFRDLFGRLPRCPGEAPGGDAENICAETTNICTDVTNVCTDSKNICPDATNVCAETTDVRADATHAPDGEVEGLRPRHMAMLRLIAAYEHAADRAEAPETGTRSPAEEREEREERDGGEENHGADESGADCKRKEEKRRKETDKENAPSPPTPLSPKEKDKEKEREKKEKPAKDPAEAADMRAMPSQPALFPADDTPHAPHAGNPDNGGGADTEGDKADTANGGGAEKAGTAGGGEATGTAGNAPARRRPGRKPAAPRLRLSREELSDERLFTGRLPFIGPAHARAMMRWARYKQERGQAYRSEDTLRTCYARYLQLCGGDPATGLALVERSVANNWSGLFAPDNQRNNQRFMTYDEQREHDRQLRRQQAGELVRELLDTNRPYDPDETRSGLDLAGLAGLGEEGV